VRVVEVLEKLPKLVENFACDILKKKEDCKPSATEDRCAWDLDEKKCVDFEHAYEGLKENSICPADRSVKTIEECKRAVRFLNWDQTPFEHSKQDENYPAGCLLTHQFMFNSKYDVLSFNVNEKYVNKDSTLTFTSICRKAKKTKE
jgi:hypothetical protein